MKRLALVLGMAVIVTAGVLILGNKHSAEGPAHGGAVTAAEAAGLPAVAAPQAVPAVAGRAERRSIRQTLEVSGSLKTDDDVEVGSRLEGKVVEVTVKEGDRVRQGQVLVRLDDRELQAQISRARATLASADAKLKLAASQVNVKDEWARADHRRALAAVEAAKSRLEQAESAAKLVESQTKTLVETSQAEVKMAEDRLAVVKASTRQQELEQARLAVQQAQAEADQARVDAENARQVLERRQTLFNQDAIAREEVDEADRRHKQMLSQLRIAEAGVAAEQAKLDLAREGSRPEEIKIAEGQLVRAQRNLNQAKSDLQKKDVAESEIVGARAALHQAEAALRAAEAGLIQEALSQDDLRNARATIEQAQADIAFYQTQLEDLVIRAPVSGVISSRWVNVGEMVTKNSRLINLIALEKIYLEAVVPELDISQLRSGQAARVTVDSLPGRQLGGLVREIIPVADRNTKSFRVRIAVNGGAATLPSGAYARATVDVGTRTGALVVPKEAVRSEAGDKFVWLIEDEGKRGPVAHRRTVTLGLVDERYAEVRQGLEPGDRIVTGGSPAVSDGAPLELSGEH